MRIVHVAEPRGSSPHGFVDLLTALGTGYGRSGHEFILVTEGHHMSRRRTGFGTVITVPPFGLGPGMHFLTPVGRNVRRLLDELAPDRIELSALPMARMVAAWAQHHSVPAVVFGGGMGSAPPPSASSGSPRSPATAPLRIPPAQRRSFDGFARVIRTSGAPEPETGDSLPREVLVPPGVDLEVFSPMRWNSTARRRFVKGSAVLLAFGGGTGSLDLAIDSLEEIRGRGIDARLVVATGLVPARLRRAAQRLPVDFVDDDLNSSAVATLLACADVALAPGHIDADTMALHAHASGTPVVASTDSPAAGILTPSSGRLVEPNGPAYAQAVSDVLEQRVDERRTAARERAAQFPWARPVELMLRVHGLADDTGIPTSSHLVSA